MEAARVTHYLEEVEALYLALRGKGLMISPADAAVVEAWEREGIPLALACRTVQTSLRGRAPRESFPPLRWCDAAVREAARRLPDAGGRADAGGGASRGKRAPDREPRAQEVAQALVAMTERLPRAEEVARALLAAAQRLPRGDGHEAAAGMRRAYVAAARAVQAAAQAPGGAQAFLAALTRADRTLCEAFLRSLPVRERAAVGAAARAAEERARKKASARGARGLRAEVLGAALERRGLVRPLSVLGGSSGR